MTGSGEHGTIFLASPVDACSPLTNTLTKDSINSGYLLIIKGGCEFVDKIRRAQAAGFKAAIVYNDEDSNLFPSIPLSLYVFLIIVNYRIIIRIR